MFDKLFRLLKLKLESTSLPGASFGSDWVVVNSLPLNADIKEADNTLRLSLINIEEEKVLKAQQHLRRDPENPDRFFTANPEIKLNLYVLASAYFANYEEALKRIAFVIRVLQQKYVYEQEDIDSMGINNEGEPVLHKVIFDLFTQTLDQQYQFSQSYGNKQIPTVLYKARIVTIDEPIRENFVPQVGEGLIEVEAGLI